MKIEIIASARYEDLARNEILVASPRTELRQSLGTRNHPQPSPLSVPACALPDCERSRTGRHADRCVHAQAGIKGEGAISTFYDCINFRSMIL